MTTMIRPLTMTIAALALLSAACGPRADDAPAQRAVFDAGAEENVQDAKDAGSEAAAASDAGVSPDAGVASTCEPTGARCPNYRVTGTDVTCDLDNSQSEDLVVDTRTGFGAGPDDAILFTVPMDGDYDISIEDQPTECYRFYMDSRGDTLDESDCPLPGATTSPDGHFAAKNPLAAGQTVLIYVGCATWSPPPQAGPYRLRIQRR